VVWWGGGGGLRAPAPAGPPPAVFFSPVGGGGGGVGGGGGARGGGGGERLLFESLRAVEGGPQNAAARRSVRCRCGNCKEKRCETRVQSVWSVVWCVVCGVVS